MATTSAITQLERQLTIPPPNFQGQANPYSIAHASLENIRENGDPEWLFLRTILGKLLG